MSNFPKLIPAFSCLVSVPSVVLPNFIVFLPNNPNHMMCSKSILRINISRRVGRKRKKNCLLPSLPGPELNPIDCPRPQAAHRRRLRHRTPNTRPLPPLRVPEIGTWLSHQSRRNVRPRLRLHSAGCIWQACAVGCKLFVEGQERRDDKI
jgi:hypothetical protein